MENKAVFPYRSLLVPAALTISFWGIASAIWQITGQVFFFWNFVYIGASIGIGMGLFITLPRHKKAWGRKAAQLLVGLYLFFYVGLALKENMQVEGFIFYLLLGYFSGSTIHYLVAKVAGPLLFGRGWCGWACWTAMILDFLPYPHQKQGRLSGRWGMLRYLNLALSLALVLALWYGLQYRLQSKADALYWMIGGNIAYYTLAVGLAFVLKDNRAFCKYLCPIAPIQKVTSPFSLMKITGNAEKCNDCGACVRACPMNIDIPRYTLAGKRVYSSECINCHTCIHSCPKKALSVTLALDGGYEEWIKTSPAISLFPNHGSPMQTDRVQECSQ